MDFNMKETLKEFLSRRKWKQSDLAEILNISPSTLNLLIKRKTKRININLIKQIYRLSDGAVDANEICGLTKKND